MQNQLQDEINNQQTFIRAYENYTKKDFDLLEQWWIEKSRKNFLAYRMFIRSDNFKTSWFMTELSNVLQSFYSDFKNKKRPIYIINTPPQHGKSIGVTDLISWMSGLNPTLRIIYAAYAERLGKRCNSTLQKTFDTEKYSKIFPDMDISKENIVTISNKLKRNSELIEFVNKNKESIEQGFFRNTTVNGSITGDSMDIGIIDDPVKGRKEARSPVISQATWEWFEDDFDTRLSEYAGVLIIMTRWVTHDLTARLTEKNSSIKLFNFQALATQDEKHRRAGGALFPELKSRVFLEGKRKRTSSESWESLYQGNPTISGGNMIKDDWWQWWKILPHFKYKFITADTAQKTKNHNDWTDLKAWGVGVDDNLYLIDHLRAKLEAPELRRIAEIFYKKHDIKKQKVNDPILRGMYIEDKSSGTGLIQELRKKKLKIIEVPRHKDKYIRADESTPYISAGRIFLNVDIPDIENTVKEAREFPNGEFDDDIDNVFTAIEIVYINKKANSSLIAALEA
jgi:predicted phage terminase large subunit-like protein